MWNCQHSYCCICNSATLRCFFPSMTCPLSLVLMSSHDLWSTRYYSLYNTLLALNCFSVRTHFISIAFLMILIAHLRNYTAYLGRCDYLIQKIRQCWKLSHRWATTTYFQYIHLPVCKWPVRVYWVRDNHNPLVYRPSPTCFGSNLFAKFISRCHWQGKS